MKFLLLVVILGCDLFCLTAGSEASSHLSVCADGWVEISCSYPNMSITRYHTVEVVLPRNQETLRSSESDRWENKGSFLLYHDTTNRNLRVTIKKLHQEDFNQFQCRFYPGLGSDHEISTVDLDPEADSCQNSSQTVNPRGKTTLTCQKRGKKLPTLFFCKEKDLICEEILSTSSSLSDGRFTLGVTSHTFSLTIRDVSSEDAGVYWCGGKPTDGRYRAPIANIQLEVKGSRQSTSPSAEPHVSLSSTTSTSVGASSSSAAPEPDGSSSPVVVAVLVLVALLVFVLLLVVVYSRLNKAKGKAAIMKEEHVYAEIQEKTDSGTVVNVLYVSASFPTMPLVPAMDPTVRNSNHYSTVGEDELLPTAPGEAFYSTVDLQD